MKNICLFICSLILAVTGFSQDIQNTIDHISSQLIASYESLPIEKIYVRTDKDIYSPGEVIWFNAKVFDRSTLTYSTLSTNLTVKVFNNKGEVILSDLFLLENGEVAGDLQLPDLLTCGRYYLAAYTPRQFNADEIFTRLIYVDQPYTSDVIVDVKNAGLVFSTKDDAETQVNVKSVDLKPASRFRINYNVFFNFELFDKGRERTDTDGNATIHFKFPDEVGTKPLWVVLTDDGNTWEKTVVVKTNKDMLKIEFFPEGGHFITGFPQKIGVVSKDIFGNYIPISGDILDSNGMIKAKCQSFTEGFGFFPFQQDIGNNYSLKITSDYGKGQIFELPAPSGTKPAISVLNTTGEFINTNILCPQGNEQKIVLTATKDLNLLWSGEITISGPSRIQIPVENFPNGLILLSAFNDNLEQVGRRLVYIDNGNNLELKINSTLHNNTIELEVAGFNEKDSLISVEVQFSVVSSYNLLEHTESLSGYFNFNSELTNKIPAGKLSGEEELNKVAIDYMLISNSIEGFSWDNILSLNPGEIPEITDNHLGLSGRVTGKYNIGIPDAKIRIHDKRTMKMYSQTTGANGKFFFPVLNPVNKEDFTIRATDAEGKKEYDVVINKTFDEQLGEHISQLDLTNAGIDVSRENMLNYLAKNNGLIKEPPKVPPFKPRETEPHYKKLLESSTDLMQVIKSIKSYQLIDGKIVFSGMINSLLNQGGAIIFIDGQNFGTSASSLDNIHPLEVAEINVYTDPSSVQRFTSFASAGVIEIITKKASPIPTENITINEGEKLYKNGYRISRDFHSVINELSVNKKKLRSTLYWNPSLKLSTDNPVPVKVPLAGLKSDFIISAECIDTEGRIGIIKTKVE